MFKFTRLIDGFNFDFSVSIQGNNKNCPRVIAVQLQGRPAGGVAFDYREALDLARMLAGNAAAAAARGASL